MHKASVEETLKLKRLHVDQWSIREQLALASSVLRSGDQNWASVSRAIKPFGEKDRPNDWFSQKNCALQYEKLLENVETPKRRRGDKGEESKPFTPGELIVEKLRSQRLEELQATMDTMKQQYAKTKQDLMKLSVNCSEEQLDQMIAEIDEEGRQEEEKKKQHKIWLKEREEKINEIQRAWRPMSFIRKKPLETSISSDAELSQDSVLSEGISIEQQAENASLADQKPTISTPTSPLLTHLLKSPASVSQSSILHSAIMAQRPPTIGSLLASSTPARREVPPFMPGLSTFVSGVLAPGEHSASTNSPSSGAPTLSMLLELPPSVPGTPLPEIAASGDSIGQSSVDELKPMAETESRTPIPVLQSTAESSKEFEEQLQKFDRNAVGNSQTNVLEELPQDVVELIEEVEEAAEAKKQQSELGQFFKGQIATQTSLEVLPSVAVQEDKIAPKDVEPESKKEEEVPQQMIKQEELELEPQDNTPSEPASEGPSTETELAVPVAFETETVAVIEPEVPIVVTKEDQQEKHVEVKEEISMPPEKTTRKSVSKELEREKESEIDESSDDDYKPRPVNILTYPARTKRNLFRKQPVSQSAQSVTDESMPNSPVSVDDEKLKTFKKAMLLIWDRIAAHKNASIFLKPITNENVAGYRNVVLRPMDLSTIKKNIETGNITSADGLQRDVGLVFLNAIMYNPSNHDISKMAFEMQKDCQEEFQVYAAAHESKSYKRETREGSKRHDASLEDAVPPAKKIFVTIHSDSSGEDN
ncbi:bromodomain-containing protein 8 isoform X2 [Neocloeon triangulifer]|uniref:bromodomain-containing protein 8 isoform X2 n=1 Tax=Neocloeon triangulifer TaxID=2078957 RepID=UPI00286F4294|nr:bromodomain-containing protein 8 isoform X2 [Neocloeon triangulifer]